MKIIKSIIALCVATALAVTIIACRTKDELLVSFEGEEIHAGLYLAISVSVKMSANSKIDEALSPSSDASSQATSSTVDYSKQKVEEKDYYTWIKDETVKRCKQYLYIEKEFNRLELSLTAEQKTAIENQSVNSWNNTTNEYGQEQAGAGSIYSKNGVALKSWQLLMENSYKSQLIFESIYAADGTSPIPEADLKKALSENYMLVNAVTHVTTVHDHDETSSDDSATKDMDEAQKKALKDRFDKYAERINKGEDFAKIYEEEEAFQKKEEEEHNAEHGEGVSSVAPSSAPSSVAPSSEPSSELSSAASAASDTSSGATSSEAPKPKDETAVLLSNTDKDSNGVSPYYEKFKDCAVGSTLVIEDEGIMYLIKRIDPLADPYYYDTKLNTLMYLLKGDEFEKTTDDAADKIEPVFNDSAVAYYNAKRIDLN